MVLSIVLTGPMIWRHDNNQPFVFMSFNLAEAGSDKFVALEDMFVFFFSFFLVFATSWVRFVCLFACSYIVKVAITEETCTACNHRPQAFPSSVFSLCDTASSLDVVFFSCAVVQLGLLGLYGRSHGFR